MSNNIAPELQRLFAEARTITFHKNEPIIRPGETPLGVYLITSGWVRVCTVCPDGEPNIISTLYKGDIFPLLWAVTGTLQSSSFITNDTTTVLRISLRDFLNHIEQDPILSRYVMDLLARRTRGYSEAHDNLHFRNAKQRISYRLITLARIFGQKAPEGIRINTSVTNEYIARSTNMTRETASREIHKLIRQGIIHVLDSRYVIANFSALQAASGASERSNNEPVDKI